jgi:hypothetical protein
MADQSLEVLVSRRMPDGSYAVVDALRNLQPVKSGFANAEAAEKFIEQFYLDRGVLRPHDSKPKA